MSKVYHAPLQPSLWPVYSVYALIDPRDDSVHYIGMSTRPEYRLRTEHMQRSYGATYDWIQELLHLGLQPILKIIETQENERHALDRELYWIHYYSKQKAPLLNRYPYKMRKQWHRR